MYLNTTLGRSGGVYWGSNGQACEKWNCQYLKVLEGRSLLIPSSSLLSACVKGCVLWKSTITVETPYKEIWYNKIIICYEELKNLITALCNMLFFLTLLWRETALTSYLWWSQAPCYTDFPLYNKIISLGEE